MCSLNENDAFSIEKDMTAPLVDFGLKNNFLCIICHKEHSFFSLETLV